MSKNGIIIDIGFAADIKDFINEVERQFKNVDFSSMLGLSDAFDKQVKDVREKLTVLQNEIDETLNGKVKNDPSKQMQALSKAVQVLASNFKEMAKVLPASETSKLTSGLDDIISEMNKASDVCNNAADAIKKVNEVAKGGVNFVSDNQIKELEKMLKIFKKVEEMSDTVYKGLNKTGNTPYKDEDEVLEDIIKKYEEYLKIQEKIGKIELDESLDDNQKTKKLDLLNAQYVQLSVTLQRLLNVYTKLGGDLKETLNPFSDMPNYEISLSSIRGELEEEFDELLSYISKRKSEIQDLINVSGGKSVSTSDVVKEVNKETNKEKITVPLDISTKSSTLVSKALAIIESAQSKIESNPLQVRVALVSGYKTKRNSEILEQIYGDLENIQDGEIKNKLTNLLDNFNSQIGNELHMKIEVEGSEKATTTVRSLVKDLQDQLDKAFVVKPEIELTKEVKNKLQSDINALSEGVTVNIGIKDESGEDAGVSSVKKEIRTISQLRNQIENVIKAIDDKTAAFQIEEQTVEGTVRREISSLAELIGWLNTVEDNIRDITTRIESMPVFKVDFAFNDGTFESIEKLIDKDMLSELSNVKEMITSVASDGSGKLIEIPEEQKKKLLKDIKKLSDQINTIFETKNIDNWTSKFLSSLNEISKKIKTLFGNNALTDMIEQWNYSDEIMKSRHGDAHLRERAAVIDDKGNIYGSGTYDQHGSTRFSYDIMNELKSRNITPKIGIHSHSSDRIVAQSIPQKNSITGKIDSADLGAFLRQYVSQGLEKQITIALNDIAVFDAKGFYDSNKSIDFTNENIKELILKKSEELKSETNKFFNQYFEQFVSEYGVIDDGSKLKSEIMSSIKPKGFANRKNDLKNKINEILEPKDLLNEFFNLTNNKKQGLGQSLTQAIVTSLKNKNFSYQDIGVKKEFGDEILKEIIKDITSNVEKILGNAFNISEFDFYLNKNKVDGDGNVKAPRDLYTYNMRQITPRILEEALKGTEYKNNYQDFMKVYSIEDFIKQNPLELSSGSLSDLFDNSAPTTFLETLDKIVSDLQEIKNISSNDSIQNAFNIKINEESLSRFTGEINRLIESIEKLPTILTEAFSSFNNLKPDQISEVNKEIDKLNNQNPIQNLESSYNNFKGFYDNNDLESEAGAKAALSYYNAYKEALISKTNKKDLQKYTFGKASDLFSGNYTDYKKGVGELDLSGLNSEITKYQEIIDRFNHPEVVSIINALTEAIEKLLAAGNGSAEATALLKNLHAVINDLGGKNSADKIERVVTNLENFQKSVQTLDISDSGFVKSLSSILEKGEELKTLGEVLKATKKQIDDASKAVKAQDNLKQSQKYLEQYENDIRKAVDQKYADSGSSVLYQNLQTTKDGVVQVTALVKNADDAYQKYVLTTTNGSDLIVKASSNNQAALAKEVKQFEIYKKMQELSVPGAKNLGEEGVTFTPESVNWSQLVNKAKEFGIEVGSIEKIIRNVDELGHESFQIFTKLSRITVGMDSNGVLFQKDDVLDAGKAIQKFEQDVENLKRSLANSFKDDMGTERFLNTLGEISNTWKELKFLNEKGLISNEDLSKSASYFEAFKTSISSISIDRISTDNKTPEFIEQLKQTEAQLDLVKIALNKIEAGEAFSDDDINQIKLFVSQMRTLYETSGDKENKSGNSKTIDKTLMKIYKTLNQNSAMSNELKQRFNELAAEIESFGDSIPADKVDEFTSRYENLNKELQKSGKTGLSFFDGIIKRAKSMSQSFISMYLSLYDVIRYIRTGLNYIKELDTALTEMRKVSDETVESLRKFQDESFDIAASVGTTAVQIQNSTADWMRLGESMEEAAKSAEVSNILLNVSEFESIDEATESLVSMSAAYNELEKIDIVDKLNQVGNNFSISTDGLAVALQKSASALTTAGNDMDEAVALITAGNAVVQDADVVGTGMQTIALRLVGTKEAKEQLEELGEDTDDVITTTSKLRDTILSATKVASNQFKGFDILDENGNYKGTYEIMLGLSELYDEIVKTDKEFGNNNLNLLLETIAGKRRANIAASILQNEDLLKSVYKSSQGAEGSAEKELEKKLDSIEGKISKFTNEVQEFWYQLISSDVVKFVVDAGTTILNIINEISDATHGISNFGLAIGAAFGINKIKNGSGGRVKQFTLIAKYATESFSREVCEFWCMSE